MARVSRRLLGRAGALGALAVSAVVVGLGAAPTAASAATPGDNCPNAEFRTGWSAKLPDCRAYEMVSPPEKGGQSARGESPGFPGSTATWSAIGKMRPTPDGNGFGIYNFLPMGEGTHSNVNSMLVMRRGATGWTSRNLAPDICWGYIQLVGSLFREKLRFATPDLSVVPYGAVKNNAGDFVGCDPEDQGGEDIYVRENDGPTEWVSRGPGPKLTNDQAVLAGLSEDGTQVLFTTPERFDPVEANRAPGQASLYLRDRVGRRTVAIGLRTSGQPINPCGADRAQTETAGRVASGQFSRDKRVVLFSSRHSEAIAGCKLSEDGGQLYARIDPLSGGARTIPLSPALAGSGSARAKPELLAATPDGRVVLFASREKLTTNADANGGIYRADLSAVLDGGAQQATLRFLTPRQTGSPGNAADLRLIDLTDDASTFYFVVQQSAERFAPGADPTVGATNVYRWSADQVTLVDAIPVGTAVPASFSDKGLANMSPDGTKLGYPRGTPQQPTVSQLYLADATGTANPACVSCPPGGATPTGPSWFMNHLLIEPTGYTAPRFVTDDGRAFFATRQQLSPDDTDQHWDVYETDGQRHELLSVGTGGQDAWFLGMTNQGRDVFIGTDASLLPQDFDNGDRDVYVARVGGGFPTPVVDRPACVGSECQGTYQRDPAIDAAGPATSVLSGGGNLPAPASAPSAVGRVRVYRAPQARGNVAIVRVRAPAKGQVRITGSGLARTYVASRKASTVRVRVRLSKLGQRRLRRTGRVTVRATVRFAPTATKQGSTARTTIKFVQKRTRKAGR